MIRVAVRARKRKMAGAAAHFTRRNGARDAWGATPRALRGAGPPAYNAASDAHRDPSDDRRRRRAVPIGTALHERTFPLCESLNYREWSGYYAVSVYESHHEHEYNAIREAAALFDISPLFKYVVSGPDAPRLVDRVVTRDIRRVAVGQIVYTPWCDEQGKVIDDGTVARVAETTYRWTAADPNLRWLHQNAQGLDVSIEDVSEKVAAVALQGPTSARVLRNVAQADIDNLKYFRLTRGTIAGVPVEISRNGYTGDLGYEVFMPWGQAVTVWDALMAGGREHDIHPAGMLALDVARIEAGMILLEVDYVGSKRALIEDQKYSPFEIGLGRLVDPGKESFVGRTALLAEKERGPRRRLVGLQVRWPEVEALYEKQGLPPTAPSTASRVPVPVFSGRTQVGRATSTTWSPILKQMIALASVAPDHADPGTALRLELTVEAVRHTVGATVVPLPFFNPPRKTATPPL
jgi:aminomethyltransferase